jgi:glyoxylate/hydroxypyruvate reductase A
MHITCSIAGSFDDASAWASELAMALPEATVRVWAPGDPPADYAVVWKPTQAFIDSQIALKAIFNAGAGVDALASLTLPVDVPVIRLEDAGMSEQMSDYVVHAVLHHFREFDLYAAQSAVGSWMPRQPRRKAQFPVGILGFGVLGQAVATSLASLGFPIVAWANHPRAHSSVRVYAGVDSLNEFLRTSRILVCLLPLTAATERILNRATLPALKPGSYVINVARGGHLDVGALLESIEDGHVAGATLDVFEAEPLPPGDPLWKHPKVRITPHIAASTLRAEAVAQIAAKVRKLEKGEAISGVVDGSRGY